MTEVDLPQAGRRPSERGSATAGDADVLCAVLRLQSSTVELVVQRRNGFTQLGDTGNRCVVEIIDSQWHARQTLGRTWNGAGLGLALAEITPARIVWRKPAAHRLLRDVDDTGAWHRPEGVKKFFRHLENELNRISWQKASETTPWDGSETENARAAHGRRRAS